MNSAESSPVKDVTDDQFMVEVIEKSKELPVLVDFWVLGAVPVNPLPPYWKVYQLKSKAPLP